MGSDPDSFLHADKLPKHVGIIMDGNGRWAKLRKKDRIYGHEEGLRAAKRIVAAGRELGIPAISLYVFSTENWRRTKKEVSFLMELIRMHLRKEFKFYQTNSIRIIHTGDLSGLPRSIQKEIEKAKQSTAAFTGLTLNLAINYGGRDEILRGVRKLLSQQKSSQDITEENFFSFLDEPELPDCDLIIRTGGEMRLSNFLLWRSAYAELYFSEKLWPDWQPADLQQAIQAFAARERRYGNA